MYRKESKCGSHSKQGDWLDKGKVTKITETQKVVMDGEKEE